MLGAPAEGRFQDLKLFTVETNQDMKAAVNSTLIFPVRHQFIQILEIGYTLMTVVGAVTTAGVYTVKKQIKNGGALAALNSLATLTFDAALVVYDTQVVALNAGVAANAYSVATRNYPLANRGDVIVFNLSTQGVGAGAQDVRPYVIYREMPVGSVQG